MWNYVDGALEPLVHLFQTLDRQQWTLVFAGVLVVGFLCMRGFGSRTNY